MSPRPTRRSPDCRHCGMDNCQPGRCTNCLNRMCTDCYCYDATAYYWFDVLETVGGSNCNSCDHEKIEGP